MERVLRLVSLALPMLFLVRVVRRWRERFARLQLQQRRQERSGDDTGAGDEGGGGRPGGRRERDRPLAAAGTAAEDGGGCAACTAALPEGGKLCGAKFKPYDVHLVVCTGTSAWPSHIDAEGEDTFEARLMRAVENATYASEAEGKDGGQDTPPGSVKVKVTACDEFIRAGGPRAGAAAALEQHGQQEEEEEVEADADARRVMVFPGRNMVTVPLDRVDVFARSIVRGYGQSEHLRERGFTVTGLPFQHLVLVCTHTARDARCGRVGPQVIEGLHEELARRNMRTDVLVRACSHVSGHKFAGVVVTLPAGDWFGHITKRNAPALLDAVLSGDPAAHLPDSWRGRMGAHVEREKQLDW